MTPRDVTQNYNLAEQNKKDAFWLGFVLLLLLAITNLFLNETPLIAKAYPVHQQMRQDSAPELGN